MSRPPRSDPAEQATFLAELIAATDPAHSAAEAARHYQRARQKRPARPAAPTPARGGRTYEHRIPTRSLVLNAFLRECPGTGHWPADLTVPHEHTLAPRLLRVALPYWPWMLRTTGGEETARALEQVMASVTDAVSTMGLRPAEPGSAPNPAGRMSINERTARFLMRRAVGDPSELGAIARDYEEHRRRARLGDEDDLRAQCIMAAFAGQMAACAVSLMGSHVTADVRLALEKLTSADAAHQRRPRARAFTAPREAPPQDALATRRRK